METLQNKAENSNRIFLILLHAGFFLIGILTVLLGQILPILSARLSLDDRQAANFFLAQFSGSLIGNFTYSAVIKKIGYQKMLFVGFLLMAFGSAGINFGAIPLCVVSVFLYGIGIGWTIPAINLLVIELNFDKSSSSSNIINFFWGFGAILCKPFVDFIGSKNDFRLPTMILAAAILITGAAIALTKYEAKITEEKSDPQIFRRIWTNKIAWLIAVFSFVHVGIESSLGGWITTYETRFAQNSSSNLISAAFTFFLFLVIGRAVVPILFRFISENAVLFLSLLTMTIGVTIILRADNFTFLILGAAITGFGSSSVFPTNMARFTNIFGIEATRHAAPLFVLGGLGGSSITWLIGIVSAAYASLKVGFSVILICCLLLLFFQLILTSVSTSAIVKNKPI